METRIPNTMALTHRKPNSSEPLRPILGQRLKSNAGSNARRALSSLGTNNRRANLRLAESLLTISTSEFRAKWNFDPIAESPLPQGQFLWMAMKPMPKVPLVDVKLATAIRPKTQSESDLATCFKLPQKDVVTKLSDDNSVLTNIENSENNAMKYMGQTCKELRCLSVKETNVEKQLCSDGENNNSLNLVKTNPKVELTTCTSTNQRQPIITEFMRSSKRPAPSSVICEAQPMMTSESVDGTTPPPTKLRRIISDGDNT